MRYTIDGPKNAIKVYGLTQGSPFGVKTATDVAVLIPLPDADTSTAAVFGKYAAEQWGTAPEFAVTSADEGAAIIHWRGWPIDINDPHTDDLYIGTLHRHRVTGEIGSTASVWTIDKSKVTA